MRRREFIAVLAAVIPGARLLRPAHAQSPSGKFGLRIRGLLKGVAA
jgi:hypothetical protein